MGDNEEGASAAVCCGAPEGWVLTWAWREAWEVLWYSRSRGDSLAAVETVGRCAHGLLCPLAVHSPHAAFELCEPCAGEH